MKDADIVNLYFARNEDAIAESQKSYGKYCTAVAMHILASMADAEECVNDTWLKAWQSIPPARPMDLKSYLGRITRNLSLDRFRALKRHKRNRDMEVAMEELSEAIPLPDDTADSLLKQLFNEFLARTDSLNRRLFVGRYWHGYTVGKLAQHYGMTENAVSHRLARTRAALKEFLEKEGYRI
ncbi:MAG: sigma-70 family RNA polymerase sigma factor [Clostridia bacterium]|nr:sigma-70 family RNA polymerase sigma factor [Clostridia bacterium]